MSGSQLRWTVNSLRVVQSLKDLASRTLGMKLVKPIPAVKQLKPQPSIHVSLSSSADDKTGQSVETGSTAQTQPPEEPASGVDQKERKKSPPKWKLQSSTSKVDIDSRTRHLVSMIRGAITETSRLTRVENLCQHLFKYPQSSSLAYKEGAVTCLLNVMDDTDDSEVRGRAREALTLVGYVEPPRGRGLRVLSIDGGGIRGIVAIELLSELERLTGRPVHQLFDLICGVSTGALLAVLVGPLRRPLAEVRIMYEQLGSSIFSQSRLRGTTKLLWEHGYYDTQAWNSVLQQQVGEWRLSNCSRIADVPKVAVVSTLIGVSQPRVYVFRTYNHPFHVQSQYVGSCEHLVWEAVRASAAAPGYFSEFRVGHMLFQDGGILVNNPAGIALYEARRLWAREPVQCLVSLGTGRFAPASLTVSSDGERGHLPSPTGATSWITKMMRVVDSATDTEGVHALLHDLLPAHRYYRFNPYLSDCVSLDDARPEKYRQLREDCRIYIRKNGYQLGRASTELLRPRARHQLLFDGYRRTCALHGIV